MAQMDMNRRDCGLIGGRHRCLEAKLVVIPDLAILHDVDALAADVDLVVSFLYIVLLGLDVATKTQFGAVGGSPQRLKHKACHEAAQKEKVTFCVGPRLKVEHEDVDKALKRIARMPQSGFTVSKTSTSASGDIFFDELRDVAAWAFSVRRVVNEMGPKSFVMNLSLIHI